MTHSEPDTQRILIEPALRDSGWKDSMFREQVLITVGRIVPLGINRHKRKRHLFADYVLDYKLNIPIAVVEAKKSSLRASDGLEQAKEYA